MISKESKNWHNNGMMGNASSPSDIFIRRPKSLGHGAMMQTIGDFISSLGLFYVTILLGYLVAWRFTRGQDMSKVLTKLIINILLPILILETLLKSAPQTLNELPSVIILTLICHLLGFAILYVRLWKAEATKTRQGALLLTVTFNNAVFLPLPLVMILVGEAGVPIIAFWSITQMILMATFGTFLGSVYSDNDVGYTTMVRKTLLFPPFLVAMPSTILLLMGYTLPSELVTVLSFNGPLTTYLALFVVGLEIGSRFSLSEVRSAIEVFSIRQVVVPLVILILLLGFGLSTTANKVVFIEAMMPPAVINVVFASSFELDSETAATVVTAGTLLLLPIIPLLPLLLM
jgi:predicted permease